MDIAKLILHPVRLRIIQYISLSLKAKTSAIAEALNDIPRSTIYHHVKILEENDLIGVVGENRVRGTVEKVYSMKKGNRLAEGDNPVVLSTAFHMKLMQEMNEYFSTGNQDSRSDNVFFTTAVLFAGDEEYKRLTAEIIELIKPFAVIKKEQGCRMRRLSIISAPPEKSEES